MSIIPVPPGIPPEPVSLRAALQFNLPDIQVGRKFDDADMGIDMPAEIIDPFKFIGTEYGAAVHLPGKVYDVPSIFADGPDKCRQQVISVNTRIVSARADAIGFCVIYLAKLLDECLHLRFMKVHIK
jgi:hypothetical protein